MYSIAPPELTAVSHWPARWIWTDGDPKPRNCYLMARRTFDLRGDAAQAELHISAADRYVLWVNGRYLGRGPARSDPRRKSYDTHDVAAHLTSGRNVIAVQAYHYGIEGSRGTGWGSSSGSSYSVGERAGLWAQLDLTLADGSAQTIGTDSDWVLRPAQGWRTDVELINSLVGFIEVYDAGADPADWTELDFDDGDWARAVEITGNDVEWFVFEKREIPQMEERMVYPREVVDVGETIDLGRMGQIDIPELLYSEPHLPLENATADEVSAALAPDASAACLQSVFAPGQGIRAPYVVVDFGPAALRLSEAGVRCAGGGHLGRDLRPAAARRAHSGRAALWRPRHHARGTTDVAGRRIPPVPLSPRHRSQPTRAGAAALDRPERISLPGRRPRTIRVLRTRC